MASVCPRLGVYWCVTTEWDADCCLQGEYGQKSYGRHDRNMFVIDALVLVVSEEKVFILTK